MSCKKNLLILTMFCFIARAPAALAEMKVSLLKSHRLQVNKLESPMIATGDVPKFSWSYALPNKDFYGLRQTAYRILVAGSVEKLSRNEGDLWDSDKIQGNLQLKIEINQNYQYHEIWNSFFAAFNGSSKSGSNLRSNHKYEW